MGTNLKQTNKLFECYVFATHVQMDDHFCNDLGLPNPNIIIEFLRAINNLI